MAISLVRALVAAVVVAGVAACDSGNTGANMLAPSGAGVLDKPHESALDVTMRWGNRAGSDAWTQATLAALDQHGVKIISQVPADVARFCPGYAEQGAAERRAFWAGLLSAVAKHESTYNPQASGGGGRWLGLMQIAPATWRHYGCEGNIRDGADNMACAVRIMARQVGRDNAIAGDGGGWRGVARDWAPMRAAAKRADIANWTRQQSYCNAG